MNARNTLAVLIGVFLLCAAPGGALHAQSKAKSTQLAVASQPTARVTLLKAGSGPLRTLRFVPKEGATETMRMQMRMSMEMSLGGRTQPIPKLPAMVMGMKIKTTAVDANGDVHYSFAMDIADVKDEPGAPPMVINAMRTAMKSIVGMSGDAVVTDRGYTKSAKINLPPTADAQMRQTMEGVQQSMGQMSAPVPEEPVGVGAKWLVTTRLNQGGMVLSQEATYTLKAFTAGGFSADISLKQSADPQTIPGGKLLSLASTGTGKMNIDLGHVVPVSSNVSVKSNIKAETMAGVAETKLSMDVTVSPP